MKVTTPHLCHVGDYVESDVRKGFVQVSAHHADPGERVSRVWVRLIQRHHMCQVWQLGILLLQTHLRNIQHDISAPQHDGCQQGFETVWLTWAILSALSLQNWVGLSKCWIRCGSRHRMLSGKPATRGCRRAHHNILIPCFLYAIKEIGFAWPHSYTFLSKSHCNNQYKYRLLSYIGVNIKKVLLL